MSNFQKIRLIDIARESNCSLASVAKVLNGSSHSIRVGYETRQRIIATAERLGYERNIIAAKLAGGRSNMYGVLLDTQASFRQQYLLTELEREASMRSIRLLIGEIHDSPDNFKHNCQVMQKYGIDELIVLSHDYPQFHKEFEEIESTLTHAVFLEKPFYAQLPYVATSRKLAMHKLVNDAVKRGKRRIAIYYDSLDYISEAALVDEYKSALNAARLAFDSRLAFEMPHLDNDIRSKAEVVVKSLIEPNKPDILFCDDAAFALVIHGLLTANGWRIPEDLEIIGGNNDPMFTYFTPKIKSFDPCYTKIAQSLLDSFSTWKGKATTINATYN